MAKRQMELPQRAKEWKKLNNMMKGDANIIDIGYKIINPIEPEVPKNIPNREDSLDSAINSLDMQ